MKIFKFLIILVFLAMLLPASGATNDIYVQNGFVDGNDFLSFSSDGKEKYAIGFIDGLLIAPLLGAPKRRLNWLEQCAVGMNSKQIVAILEKYLTENPAKWHQSMHGLSLSAMKASCNQ